MYHKSLMDMLYVLLYIDFSYKCHGYWFHLYTNIYLVLITVFTLSQGQSSTNFSSFFTPPFIQNCAVSEKHEKSSLIKHINDQLLLDLMFECGFCCEKRQNYWKSEMSMNNIRPFLKSGQNWQLLFVLYCCQIVQYKMSEICFTNLWPSMTIYGNL